MSIARTSMPICIVITSLLHVNAVFAESRDSIRAGETQFENVLHRLDMSLPPQEQNTWPAYQGFEPIIGPYQTEGIINAYDQRADYGLRPSDSLTFTSPSGIYQYSPSFSATSNISSPSYIKADFTPKNVQLSQNSRQVARVLQGIWQDYDSLQTERRKRDGGPSIEQLFSALSTVNPNQLNNFLTSIGPQSTQASVAAATQLAIGNASRSLSCPAFTSDLRFRKQACLWGQLDGAGSTQEFEGSDERVRGTTFGPQFGGHYSFGDNWFWGNTLALTNTFYEQAIVPSKLKTTALSGALSLEKALGPWTVAGVVGGGYVWGKSRRRISQNIIQALGEATANIGFAFSRARVSLGVPFKKDYYIRPILDFDVFWLHQAGYSEVGAGDLNLNLESDSKFIWGFNPAIEFGSRLNLRSETVSRIYLDLGALFLSANEWGSTVTFRNFPNSSFRTWYPITNRAALVRVGLDVQQIVGFETRLQFSSLIAEDYEVHGGSLRMGFRF
ncbi:autotransporter outer membrane beta-barrel domain-containing protein [Flexibacterium corallicola]|uniref:autotransporter outer membrane beta-barrel domain-containing protein n=1 Tax=Flexibacterium corallicola TaxID=3037259 RepID=UPI00286F3A65|nr:autotransporter outer membrane beta-barrel domain-containing protein [Pseudovibrio sp. M1P-2-3]